MTFAAPLFLLAALAAAIPIALHMINRRKAKEMPFSTLRFLKIGVEKTRRRRRIHDALLMAIRAAVLLLIAAGLARPAVTNLSALWSGAHSAVAIVLDNSASMGTIDNDRLRFDTAAAAAAQILDQLSEGDQAALLPTCGPAFPNADKLDRTQDTVRQVLAQCRVSYQRADLRAKLRQARRLLAGSEAPNKYIYVLSDMQKVSWEEERGEGRGATGEKKAEGGKRRAEEAGSGQSAVNLQISNPQSLIPNPSLAPIILVDCNRTPKPNVAVEGVELEAAAPLAGLPVKATVTLLNTSTVPQRPRVELLLDGMKQSSSPELSVPPEGRAKHEFPFSLSGGGLHRGEVRLAGEDGSKYDDRRFFAVQVDQKVPVAIVRAQRHEIPSLDDAYYLERAFAPDRAAGWALQGTSLTADDLLAEPLEKYKVVFCVNLPALGAEAAERLRAYLSRGGNVFWTCGENVDPESYNQMNRQAGGQLLPAPLVDIRAPGPQENRDSWHIGFLDKQYPAFGRLIEPASLYESVLVYKHVRMAVGDGAARVLARLDDGEPLLALRSVEKGKVLLLGTTVRVDWSNLPLRPIFLPLVARLTLDLAEVEHNVHNSVAGRPLALQFPDQARTVAVEVVPPTGETLRLNSEGQQGKAGQTFRYADTHQIGVYLFRVLGTTRPTEIAYSVNFDPDEADPRRIDRQELEKSLGDAPLVFADNPDDLSATFALLREGKSLWSMFLTAVLVALVFETFVSNRLSPRGR